MGDIALQRTVAYLAPFVSFVKPTMINQMPGIASHTQTDSEIANVFLKSRF